MILGYQGGFSVITRVHKSEDEDRGEVRGKGMQKGISHHCWIGGWRVAHKLKKQASSNSWKDKDINSFLQPPKENTALQAF